MARLKLNLSYRWWNASSPRLEDDGGVVGRPRRRFALCGVHRRRHAAMLVAEEAGITTDYVRFQSVAGTQHQWTTAAQPLAAPRMPRGHPDTSRARRARAGSPVARPPVRPRRTKLWPNATSPARRSVRPPRCANPEVERWRSTKCCTWRSTKW
jgi:hypothetical protein